MNHNKTIFILTISLLASLILAGCGTQTAPEPPATQAPQTQPQSVSSPQGAPPTAAESNPTAVPAQASTEMPTEASSATVSFANDVMPIIQSRCINCHGGERVEKGLNLGSYADLMAGSENGPVIVPGDAANSLLVELVTNQKMPKRGPKLTPPQVKTITDWVAAGALNN